VLGIDGQTFTGLTGATYTAGKQEEIGPGDVRQALMFGWKAPPEDASGGAWSGQNHPDMLTVTLKDFEARIAALEALVKPASVIA
jgi:hypothetical protein